MPFFSFDTYESGARYLARCARVGFITLLACAAVKPALALTAADQLATYAAQAGQAPQSVRGQEFFMQKHGHEWSCASCHTATPTGVGKHASTGKAIRPMAPAVNPERFSDAAKSEKWFRRNCNDVVGRECTPVEKADVLAWLLTLKN
jgi:mono/diheme cytochrome c family protein